MSCSVKFFDPTTMRCEREGPQLVSVSIANESAPTSAENLELPARKNEFVAIGILKFGHRSPDFFLGFGGQFHSFGL